jgi:cold shock CspA family protein
MAVPLEIVFEGMEPSEAVRVRIEREAEKLEQFNDRITACRIAFQAPRHRQRKGGLFETRIHIVIPGQGDIAVRRSPSKRQAHEDPYVCIRDAFNAARRQLQDKTRKLEGKVKVHETPPHGRVAQLFPEQGYGFIVTPENEEIYFHRNSVSGNGFSELEVGTEVRFAHSMGDNGPQATGVHAVGKHHPA